MIEFRNIVKKYNNVISLTNVNCKISDGEVISLIGPAGAGKSTFIRLINLLEKPTSGEIFIDNKNILSRDYDVISLRKRVGIVFSRFNLFNHLSVIENIMKAQIDILKKTPEEAYKESIRLLDLVSLVDKKYENVDKLKSGEKQRVALVRALAMNPDILLLDEPTSALDPTMVPDIEAIIHDLKKSGKTIIVATRNMTFAKNISTRVFYIDENTVYEEGTPDEIFLTPSKPKTKQFINSLKILTLDIDSPTCDFWLLGAEIDKYCIKNHISSKGSSRLRLAFEELVIEIIISKLKNITPKIHIAIEYSNINETLKMKVKYNGDKFDPKDTENTLSYNVLRTTVNEIEYKEINDGEYVNELRLTLNNQS